MKRLSLILLLSGCATAYYPLTCVDYASSAGHAYEHIVKQPAEICVGKISKTSKKQHAQGRSLTTGKWLKVLDGNLYIDVSQELGEIFWCTSVREFDKRYNHR